MKRLMTFFIFVFAMGVSYCGYGQLCDEPTSSREININNIRALVHNGGDMFWNLAGRPRFEVPKGSGIHSVFMANLWMGGLNKQDSSLKVAGGRFRSSGIDYSPGALTPEGEVDSALCAKLDFIAAVSKTDILHFLSGTDTSEAILEWPGSGNPRLELPVQPLAPFYDVNGDGVYNPDDGDYPEIKGDMALWYVMNDLANAHTETGGDRLGVEVHTMIYGYLISGHLHNTLFFDYKIHSKGQDLAEFYLGKTVDPDIGNPFDDRVGCDTVRDMGICYNGNLYDQDNAGYLGYGNNPPQLGVRAVKRPESTKGEKRKMSSFRYYNNDASVTGDPSTPADYYNYLRNFWKDGTRMVEGGNGHQNTNSSPYTYTNFMFPAQPNDTGGWNECTAGFTPYDRRFAMSFGPFDFEKGDEIEATFAYIWVRDIDTAAGGCGLTFIPIQEASDEVTAGNDTLTDCDSFDPEFDLVVDDENADEGLGRIELSFHGVQYDYYWSNGAAGTVNDSLYPGYVYLTISNGEYCFKTEQIPVGDFTGVKEQVAEQRFKVYPNPASSNMRIVFEENTDAVIRIFDGVGKNILEERSPGGRYHTFDVSRLQPGIYFLQVESEGKRGVKKIAISR